jgi:hypothetical protein
MLKSSFKFEWAQTLSAFYHTAFKWKIQLIFWDSAKNSAKKRVSIRQKVIKKSEKISRYRKCEKVNDCLLANLTGRPFYDQI